MLEETWVHPPPRLHEGKGRWQANMRVVIVVDAVGVNINLHLSMSPRLTLNLMLVGMRRWRGADADDMVDVGGDEEEREGEEDGRTKKIYEPFSGGPSDKSVGPCQI
ncbi:hypothetical protein A2U01_0046235 [Trifolium medium]|uniref:Uncharacterized protein n=1 Tax=Trifolium medium TaxID=97028 RepID=A0A392QM77_9FABA|nr:hypothetical protein [Trifolium medium]